jgi:SAM-dependent methyltransferase
VAFDVPAGAYDRLMGRYAKQLAPQMADLAGIGADLRVLDVGCGPGALTAELVRRVGTDAVTAVDPSERFVAAARERHPGVDVQLGSAEELAFPDESFDAALAQLVVHFMRDPVRGLSEMGRVTRPGGAIAACVWDHAGGEGPISVFWDAAHEIDPDADDESRLAGARRGHLVELFQAAGLDQVEESVLTASVDYETFDDWWEPFTLGVGPAGGYATRLDAEQLAQLRERCRARLPDPPFTIDARAWAARGLRP